MTDREITLGDGTVVAIAPAEEWAKTHGEGAVFYAVNTGYDRRRRRWKYRVTAGTSKECNHSTIVADISGMTLVPEQATAIDDWLAQQLESSTAWR